MSFDPSPEALKAVTQALGDTERLYGGAQSLKDMATAAITAYEAAQWQPIETAPKDGTPILAYEPGEVPCVVQALRYNGHLIWQACCYDMEGLNKPTHWRPLPPPPA